MRCLSVKPVIVLALTMFPVSWARAQEGVVFSAYETISNGSLAIYESCNVVNIWGPTGTLGRRRLAS